MRRDRPWRGFQLAVAAVYIAACVAYFRLGLPVVTSPAELACAGFGFVILALAAS